MVAVLFACACDSPERQASAAASRVADLAATPDQARLWREAADQGLAIDLQRAPAVERPVAGRPPVKSTNQQVPQQPVVIPAGVLTAVRILSAPDSVPTGGFAGGADVVGLVGERMELDFGQQRRLTVLARAGGNAIPAQLGGKVQVEYRARIDPRVPGDVLAIRTATGRGVAVAVEGGDSPVTLSVALFGLVATQIGIPGTAVEVRVGGEKRTMKPQETAQIGGLNVTLIGSSAHTGEAAGRIEGSPYTINLIAWR